MQSTGSLYPQLGVESMHKYKQIVRNGSTSDGSHMPLNLFLYYIPSKLNEYPESR